MVSPILALHSGPAHHFYLFSFAENTLHTVSLLITLCSQRFTNQSWCIPVRRCAPWESLTFHTFHYRRGPYRLIVTLVHPPLFVSPYAFLLQYFFSARFTCTCTTGACASSSIHPGVYCSKYTRKKPTFAPQVSEASGHHFVLRE